MAAMSLLELIFIAVGLSMDAFAASVCAGLTMPKAKFIKMLTVGLYFGGFQAAMPLAGFWAARMFADRIIAYDHWIAFILLCFLGGSMILEGLKKEECEDRKCPDGTCCGKACPRGAKPEDKEISLKPAGMLPLAVATSIDALAVGVSFALIPPKTGVASAVSLIGLTTLVISMAGVKIGCMFGMKFKSKATLAGGIILILIGVKILVEHLFF